MNPKTVAFHSLGCKVNKYETDAIATAFREAGYQIKNFKEVCDVYVVNTCTVTGEANRKSRQFLRQAKKRNPHAITVAAGCYSVMNPSESISDIMVGNKGKKDIVKIVEEKQRHISGNDRMQMDSGDLLEFDEMGTVISREETRAIVKIEDGCNNFCSYCIIPYARGRVRSRKVEAILQEVTDLAKAGFKEIVITGIHVCAFTTDVNAHTDAVLDIAERIAGIDGIERIRLGSLEPDSMTDVFVRKLSINPQLCPHFHISLQSGSDSILRSMNRRYTVRQFEQVVADIRAKIPGVMITTDIIAGFPGETEIQHQETVAFCRKMNFLDMHVFKFSRRKGTLADKMKEQITPIIINRRSSELIALAQDMRSEHFQKMLHREVEILVEKVEGHILSGYTDNYFPVRVHNESVLSQDCRGTILKTQITEYDQETLISKINI